MHPGKRVLESHLLGRWLRWRQGGFRRRWRWLMWRQGGCGRGWRCGQLRKRWLRGCGCCGCCGCCGRRYGCWLMGRGRARKKREGCAWCIL